MLRPHALTIEKKISGILGKPRYYKINSKAAQPRIGCQQLSAKLLKYTELLFASGAGNYRSHALLRYSAPNR
jgi:hypothetical protein